jgi:hypothetical protein
VTVKLRVAFVADCTVHGGKIPKEDLVRAFVDWLYESDGTFGDQITDYISEECEFDSFEISVDGVNVK